MKAVILAAGYGTRLLREVSALPINPLLQVTKQGIGVAKALISINNQPVVEHLVAKITQADIALNNINIITNQAFWPMFVEWAKKANFPVVNLINDGTETNDSRLGSNVDLQLYLEQCQINEDLLIIAGDTLFNCELLPLISLADSQNNDVATGYEELWERMPKHGMIVVQNGLITDFIEKPENPTSNLAFPSILILKKSTLPKLPEFLTATGKKDGFGFFISWLIKNGYKIRYYQIPGRYDLGTLADCQKAEQELL